MDKEVFVFGDIEIGGGTLTDDFIMDRELSKLFLKFSAIKTPVDLVLNGDTFDFLKCPVMRQGTFDYPRYVSADISIEKLERMQRAHPAFFSSLTKFVHNKDHRLFFIIGNHDQDLFFTKVQRRIKKTLGAKKDNVFFVMHYHEHDVYVEHGQQYDFINKVNLKRVFLNYQGEKILNFPWIELALISKFMSLKEEHPFLERIKPYPVLFTHYRSVVKKLNYRTLGLFLKTVFYYPLRHFNDPTYIFPRKLLQEIYRRVKHSHWDVDDIFSTFRRRKRKILIKTKINVLGHVHQRYLDERKGRIFIHPDTWRDEYILDGKTKILTSKNKSYVRIRVRHNCANHWELVEAQIKPRTYLFDEVVRDELGMLALAAKDEGFDVAHLQPPTW